MPVSTPDGTFTRSVHPALENEFRQAVGLFKRPPASKLIKPGMHKFLRRLVHRYSRHGVPMKVRLFFGEDMNVVLPEVISESLYLYGFFDEIVSSLALQLVSPGDHVVDVGAHFGYFSLLFSRLVGEGGRVISFEPTPSTFAVLKENSTSARNIKIVNAAIGSAEGTQKILDYGLTFSAWNTLADESRMPAILHRVRASAYPVPIVDLDTHLEAERFRPDVIKIDSENFEYQVVSGMQKTLERFRPKLLMECGSEESLRAAVLLRQRHYQTYIPDSTGRPILWRGSLEEANRKYKDLVFMPS